MSLLSMATCCATAGVIAAAVMSAAKLTLNLPMLAELFALMMFPHRVWSELRVYTAL